MHSRNTPVFQSNENARGPATRWVPGATGPKFVGRGLWIGLLCVMFLLVLIGCGPATTEPPIMPQEPTAAVRETEPGPVPTPTRSVEELLPEAAILCEASFYWNVQMPEGGMLPAGPILALNKKLWDPDRTWRHYYSSLDIDQAQSPSEIVALICIRESREYSGQYHDGQIGYKPNWQVRVVSWTDGQLLAVNAFEGGDAPQTKSSGSGPAYGGPPSTACSEWLASLEVGPVPTPGPTPTFSPAPVMILAGTSTGGVPSLAVSPDGDWLAAGYEDRSVRLWDAETGEEKARLEGHQSQVTGLAFSPDGSLLASGACSAWDWDQHTPECIESEIRLWEVPTGGEAAILAGHRSGILGLAFSPDGQLLASSGRTPLVMLWDVATKSELATLDCGLFYVYGVAFSPDGNLLATGGDGGITLWEVETHEEAAVFGGLDNTFIPSLAFSPDGRYLALATSVGDAIQLWDVGTFEETATLLGHEGQVLSVAFSPSGKVLASGGADNTVRLWDVATGTQIAILAGHTSLVVAFSPDGALLISAGMDGRIIVWEVPAQ